MTKSELFNLRIDEIDNEIYDSAVRKWDLLSKPIDGFGDFERVVASIAAIQKNLTPKVAKKALIIMCADNGIVEEGVSQSPKEITHSVALNIANGTSSACTLARSCGTDVLGIDIGIDCEDIIDGLSNHKVSKGTNNFLRKEAMTYEEVMEAINVGIKIVGELKHRGYDILAVGEMGIGNTTTSTAVLSFLLKLNPELVTGRGAGLDDEGLNRKKEVIKKAHVKYEALNKLPGDEKAFEVLRAMGGLDIAGLTGVYLGAGLYGIPVVNDGLISSTAALVASMIEPKVLQYIIGSHKGREGGNKIVLEALNIKSYIDGNMALGEGTGALMMLKLIDAMVYFYNNASSFEEVSIEAYTRYES